MIIVITSKEFNEKKNKYETYVSHGVDSSTLKNVVLPQILISEIGAVFNEDINEYVLD
jgi:hypothetical protein